MGGADRHRAESLRNAQLTQTKVALVYKKVGNLRARQLLLGHRKLESTVRDLGIEVEREISAP